QVSRRPADIAVVGWSCRSFFGGRRGVAAALVGLLTVAGAWLAGSRALATGTYTQYTLVASGPGPVAVAAGSDGNVWFAVAGGSSAIGRITDSGTQTLFSSGLSSQVYNGLGTIAAGPDGNVWFTE